MKVVVAGGSGFVGRHVVEALRGRGHEVVVLARGTRETPAGAQAVRCDLSQAPPPLDVLRGAGAMVNLAGIKRPTGRQTFEAVHVGLTERLIAACRESSIRRFVHVSVVCSRPDARSPYHDTKWRAEAAVRASGLDFTILKPGVIHGDGDDMVTHLVKMVRFAAAFPVVGRGESLLQPVDVRDVAESVAAALDRPRTIGAAYDVVGPEPMTLHRVVETVAEGTGLPLRIVATPVPVQRLAVRVMDAVASRPLSTPAQLQMLIEGLTGDPRPARRDLGLAPRAFTAESVRPLAERIRPLFGFSLRLVDGRRDAEFLARRRDAVRPALGLALLALVLQLVLAALVSNVWLRMAVAGVLLSAMALVRVPVGWRDLFRVRPEHIGLGLAVTALLYGLGAAVTAWAVHVPALAIQVARIYGWMRDVPRAAVIPLVFLIVLAEEIVWRNAITLPLAARLGPWRGTVAAAVLFAAAHVPMGVPLLLAAALGAGAAWSALVVKTRSAIPALVSHLVWDLLVLVWLPYVRT